MGGHPRALARAGTRGGNPLARGRAQTGFGAKREAQASEGVACNAAAAMEEEVQVNPAELLELVSGLREKDAVDGQLDQGYEYRKGENCLCAWSVLRLAAAALTLEDGRLFQGHHAHAEVAGLAVGVASTLTCCPQGASSGLEASPP